MSICRVRTVADSRDAHQARSLGPRVPRHDGYCSHRTRQGIGRGKCRAGQRVPIDVAEQRRGVGDLQPPFLLVGPGAVVVHGYVYAVADRAEGLVEKRVRQDAVHVRAEVCPQLEVGRAQFGRSGGEEYLASRYAEREGDRAYGGLPQPMADLVVKRFRLAGFDDVGVIAQVSSRPT